MRKFISRAAVSALLCAAALQPVAAGFTAGFSAGIRYTDLRLSGNMDAYGLGDKNASPDGSYPFGDNYAKATVAGTLSFGYQHVSARDIFWGVELFTGKAAGETQSRTTFDYSDGFELSRQYKERINAGVSILGGYQLNCNCALYAKLSLLRSFGRLSAQARKSNKSSIKFARRLERLLPDSEDRSEDFNINTTGLGIGIGAQVKIHDKAALVCEYNHRFHRSAAVTFDALENYTMQLKTRPQTGEVSIGIKWLI